MTYDPYQCCFLLSAILFVIGISGIVVNRTNFIFTLLSIEIMLLAANVNFVSFASAGKNSSGHAIAMIVLSVSAAEAAIGLALFVNYFRERQNLNIKEANQLKH